MASTALIAAWLAGPRAIVSHRAAAMLWRLDGIDAGPLEVLTDRWARRCRLDNVKLHEATDITSADRTEVDGIPCASVVRVLLDLPSAVHHFRADQAFEDALRRQLCTVDQVADRFVQVARRGRPGTVVLLGWLVLRITWEQLTRQPEVVTRQLVIAFRRHQYNLR